MKTAQAGQCNNETELYECFKEYRNQKIREIKTDNIPF
jgi:hypothetical protein